jgi:hypothetical protein
MIARPAESAPGHFETKSNAYRCASIGLILLQELTSTDKRTGRNTEAGTITHFDHAVLPAEIPVRGCRIGGLQASLDKADRVGPE